MKKILSTSVLAFAFALVAAPALASNCCGGWHPQQSCCPEVTIDADNFSSVSNFVSTISNSGKNLAKGWFSGITSGASTAGSIVDNAVGQNSIEVVAPSTGKVNIDVANMAKVNNMVTTVSNSGKNMGGFVVSGASTAAASVANVVGLNIVKITK